MNYFNDKIPKSVVELILTLQDNGFEGWVVGGAIRTLLRGSTPHDWDITTNATPDQVQKIFPHTIETGIAYGTVTVVMQDLQIQVTTYRKESHYSDHRRPSQVSYCKSIDEDLSRRDFTINAIAYNPVHQEFYDPFDGVEDLKHEIIKAVGDASVRFQEDSLRILRALRFQSQLGFYIHDETLDAIKKASKLLPSLSRERVFDELSKWMVGDHFSMTRRTINEIGFKNLFEIEPKDTLDKSWDLIGTISPSVPFRFSAFLELYTGGLSLPIKLDNSLKLLHSLKCSQKIISKVIQFIEFFNQQFSPDILNERVALLKKALEIGFEDSVLLLQWKLHQDRLNPLYLKQKNLIENLKMNGFESKVSPLAINGNQVMEILNLSPGPEIKTILEKLQNWVLEHPNQNQTQVLKELLIQKQI